MARLMLRRDSRYPVKHSNPRSVSSSSSVLLLLLMVDDDDDDNDDGGENKDVSQQTDGDHWDNLALSRACLYTHSSSS